MFQDLRRKRVAKTKKFISNLFKAEGSTSVSENTPTYPSQNSSNQGDQPRFLKIHRTTLPIILPDQTDQPRFLKIHQPTLHKTLPDQTDQPGFLKVCTRLPFPQFKLTTVLQYTLFFIKNVEFFD